MHCIALPRDGVIPSSRTFFGEALACTLNCPLALTTCNAPKLCGIWQVQSSYCCYAIESSKTEVHARKHTRDVPALNATFPCRDCRKSGLDVCRKVMGDGINTFPVERTENDGRENRVDGMMSKDHMRFRAFVIPGEICC